MRWGPWAFLSPACPASLTCSAMRCSAQVGMQNSALGAVLAGLHFADPLTAVPCAISACTHSLLGSALATFFRSRDAATDSPMVQTA